MSFLLKPFYSALSKSNDAHEEVIKQLIKKLNKSKVDDEINMFVRRHKKSILQIIRKEMNNEDSKISSSLKQELLDAITEISNR